MDRGKYYTFRTIAPGVLGAEYNNVKLASVLDYTDALKKRNVIQIQAAVYPYITDTTVKIEDYSFYVFRGDSGEDIVLAGPWIDPSSVVETTTQNATIVITDTDNNSVNTLKSLMNALGMQYTVTIENV